MSIDSSIVPEIKITPPDGELLYVNPYIGGKAEIDEYGNIQITHGYLRADWGSSSPLIYNVTGGILYVNQGPDDSDAITIDIGDSTDTSTEPSDLKNTKSNIREIKPDINSELKRV